MIPPVLKQPRRFGIYLPLAGLGPLPPPFHMTTHLVDDRRGIVLLFASRESLPLIKNEARQVLASLPLLGFRDGRDEFGTATILDDPLSRLPLGIELPMAQRVLRLSKPRPGLSICC